MFSGTRSSSTKVPNKDMSVCIAIVEALLPFPIGEEEEEQFLVDREAVRTLEFRRRELEKSSSTEIFSVVVD